MGLPALLLRAGKEGETNTKWVAILLQDYLLPSNVVATTSAAEACAGAQYAIHAVPVQHSRAFLHAIKVHIRSRACLVACGGVTLLAASTLLLPGSAAPAPSIWVNLRMLSRTCHLWCAPCYPADACHSRKVAIWILV